MVIGQPIDTHIHMDHEPELNKFFKACIKSEASDLHLKVGQVPKLRLRGLLKNTTGEALSEAKMEQLIFEIMSPAQKDYFLKNGALDFAHEVTDVDRFRINVFRQRGMMSLAARRITSRIPPFETLHLPPVVEKISQSHEGLVLVTGPTGCGKTTTIASMIDYVSGIRACHIVTIEDPIEYLYKDKKAIISQREIGIDVPNFEEALRSLMRQDPDVVLVGEMRDNATITAAMRAAETGHLVFGTLHSSGAAQTIQRLLDLFPQEERDLARQTFALTCKAIISQQLLPSIKEGVSRIPAVEILIANPIVKKLLSEGREADLASVMRSCVNEGMQDYTESICQLVNKEYIDLKVAKEYAPNKEELAMALKGIRSATSGIL
jgi:twitching motility protein PilT